MLIFGTVNLALNIAFNFFGPYETAFFLGFLTCFICIVLLIIIAILWAKYRRRFSTFQWGRFRCRTNPREAETYVPLVESRCFSIGDDDENGAWFDVTL